MPWRWLCLYSFRDAADGIKWSGMARMGIGSSGPNWPFQHEQIAGMMLSDPFFQMLTKKEQILLDCASE
jgi:hypothetical protein